MAVQLEDKFKELIGNKRKFIETLMVVENKQRQVVPFKYNPIQADADATQTGMDIWVKPSSVGFSTERINNRLIDTLTNPGTNTVLVAYEDFITQRLLSKVTFSYNHLSSLNIPGFPVIHHDSDFQKTFRFYLKGKMIGTSSIYIASARSKTAGRAEVIHHLLLDEHAFYVPEATERIIAPAMARRPPEGTVDTFSTPNGEENDFHNWYIEAKQGTSLFTPHFYPWFVHPEYTIDITDVRVKDLPGTDRSEFSLGSEEETLVFNRGLTFDQIRWRRWMNKVMDSLRRKGETRTLFKQEFPEDDVSCFLVTGDMYFDLPAMDRISNTCYPAKDSRDNLHIWYQPEKGRKYFVSIDPGQAKITQSAITVLTFMQDELGNYKPRYCARDAGLYTPEVTARKAIAASDYYNRAEIGWEANSHGLAITELLKNRRPIYMRKDIVSGKESIEPGWLTTPKTKDYMLQTANKYLYDLECHDIEFVRQCRNHRLIGDKVEVVGPNDIFMSFAIGLVCMDPKPVKRGFVGRTGWRW
ncbi:hypothetical protein LCGC14_0392870 [marine sediment metagenome]|uniref:Terminase large subunit gp17-like C-terminal domain-containing protein n=1 Tax=marine sediment metagenome TaxID=412755 RepID=A0A0F9VL14_9ZZZZ